MMRYAKSWLLTILLQTAATSCTIGTAAETEADVRVKRSDDTSSLTLQTLVQQQAATIQTLQARLTALETETTQTLQARLTALEAETAQLKASQQALSTPVAFSVRLKTDPVSVVTHTTLKFDDIISNIGSSYDPQTGIFTAPVRGVYSFFLTTMGMANHPDLYLSIDKHGVILDKVFAEGSHDNYDQGSTQITVHLEAGEQVWVRQESGDAARGDTWTVFTGYLVQAQP